MPRYDIAVATKKPKTFYIIVDLLKRLGLNFQSCAPGDKICDIAKVVITTYDEASDIDQQRLVIVDEIPDETIASFDIMTRFLRVRNPREVIIGIDPGLHIGLVVIADGTTLSSRIMVSIVEVGQAAINLAQIAKERFPKSNTIIRVGLGSKLYSTLLLRALVTDISLSNIELVDERYTTSPGGYLTDQESALLIAARNGRKPEESDLFLKQKTGFIRALQHLFSWLTNNRGELSIETARRILSDEITLADALSEYYHLEKNSSTE